MTQSKKEKIFIGIGDERIELTGKELENLEWLDDPKLRPKDAAIKAKAKELDEDPNYPNAQND